MMISKATIVRFVETFVAVFIVAFAANPIFAGDTVDLFGAGALQALATAVVAAAALAFRRVVAVNQK